MENFWNEMIMKQFGNIIKLDFFSGDMNSLMKLGSYVGSKVVP